MKNNILNGLPEAELSREEEATADAETLILHNLRKAVPYAIAVSRGSIQLGTALSLCYEAMSESAKNFKPDILPFFAYSKPFIRGKVSRAWRKDEVVKNAHANREDQPMVKHAGVVIGEDNSGTDTDWTPHTPMPKPPSFEDVSEPPEFDAINLRERWAIVQPLVMRLSEQERTILRLKSEGSFTFEEIANMMVPKVTKAAIHIAYQRALRKLRNALMARNLYKL